MNRISNIILATAAILLGCMSCKDKNGGEITPVQPVQQGPFAITLTEITPRSVTVSVSPEDKSAAYYSHVVSVEAFDRLGESDVRKFMKSYIDFCCSEYNLTTAEVVEELVQHGDDSWSYEGLVENTRYIVFAVGIAPDGTCTTDPATKEFTSGSLPPVEKSDCTFAIVIEDIRATSARVSIAPSDKSASYFYEVIPAADYPSDAEGRDQICRALVELAAYDVMDATGLDYNSAMERIALHGDDFLPIEEGTLTEGTEYAVIAFGIDAYGRLTTEPQNKNFTTPYVEPSDNIITLELVETSAIDASVRITTTNDDPYYAGIFLYSNLLGATDAQIIEAIVEQGLANGDNKGSQVFGFDKTLMPSTRYSFVAFGYDSGVTTGLSRCDFETDEGGDPATCTFDVTAKHAGFKVEVNVRPSDETVFYATVLTDKASNTSDLKLIANIETELDEIAADMGMKRADILIEMLSRGEDTISFNETPEHSYDIAVIPFNNNGECTGKVYRTPYTAPAQVVSDANVTLTFDKYYNGRELYAFDPVTYAAGKDNLAYVPTVVTPNDKAVEWYVALYADDLSDRSDRSIITNLKDYGGERNPATLSYCWAYFYDVTYWGSDGIVNTFCAVALDAAGNYGPVTKIVFQPTTAGVSPISDITGSSSAAPAKTSARRFVEPQGEAMQTSFESRRPTNALPHLNIAATAPATVPARYDFGSGARRIGR